MVTNYNGTSIWVNGYSEINDSDRIAFLLRLANAPTAGIYEFRINIKHYEIAQN